MWRLLIQALRRNPISFFAVLCCYVLGSTMLMYSLGKLPSLSSTGPMSAFDKCAATTVRTAKANQECVKTWRAACCPPMPPLKLLPSGSEIVDRFTRNSLFDNATCARPMSEEDSSVSCIAPPVFYRQYMNAYVGKNYRLGVPIIADEFASPRTIRTVRTLVLKLIDWCEQRALPFVRNVLSASFVRVAILSCRDTFMDRGQIVDFHWEGHPEGIAGLEIGGGMYDRPTTGVEEARVASGTSCFNKTQARTMDVTIEEFFHTIHTVVLEFADPDAHDTIVCLSVRDTLSGVFNPAQIPPAIFTKMSDGEKFTTVMRVFGGSDWKGTMSLEYFIGVISIWLGSPNDEISWNGTASRAIMKKKTPELACLVSRYFPDVGDTDGNFCSTGDFFDPAGKQCRRYPGSCFCGNTMTAEYLGNRLRRTSCESLQIVKEKTGLRSRTLPTTASSVKCYGCRNPGCGEVFFD